MHRDLKPSNILVTAAGVPKLLDFGIAKMQNDDASRTLTGHRAATPLYASPEQLSGGAVTAASDIYSLGVILYELLTGTHPYRAEGEAPHVVAAAICERDPEPPGKRAGQKSWARDLDRIVMRAMQKDPARRFASAAELSEEIGRYLEHEPVRARVPWLSHQSRRMVRRWWLPSLAGVVVVALTAGLYWHGRAPSAKSPRRSVAVLGFQNLAGRSDASWIATALSEMLVTELASTESVRMISGETVTRVRHDLGVPESQAYSGEALDRLRANLNADYFVTGGYMSSPGGGASGGSSPGDSVRVYVRLQDARTGQILAASEGSGTATQLPSLVNEAARELLRAAAWKDIALGDAPGSLRPFANAQSARYHAEGLDRLRRFDTQGARDEFAKAVAADPKNPLAHSALSGALAALGYDDKAQAEARLAFDLATELPREERLSIEARYREQSHDWSAAVAACRQLQDLFPDNPEYGLRLAQVQDEAGTPRDAVATLAALRSRLGNKAVDPRIDLEEAQAASLQSDYKNQLAASERAFESASRLNARFPMARALQYQGDALYGLERNDDALLPYQSAAAIYRNLGNEFGAASVLHRIGRVYWKKGDFDKLAECDRQALEIFERIGSRNSIPAVLNNLALAHRGHSDFQGALELLTRAVAIDRELGNTDVLAGALSNEGSILRRLNRPDEARRDFEECLAIALRQNDRDQIARAHITLEALDFDEGNLLSAAEHLRETHKFVDSGGDSLIRMSVLQRDGEIEYARGDWDAARRATEAALEMARRTKSGQYLADSEVSLANILWRRKDFPGAHRLLAEARAYYVPRKQTTELQEAELVESRVLLAEGDAVGAEATARKALADAKQLKSAAAETRACTALAAALLGRHEAGAARAVVAQCRPAFAQTHDYEAEIRYKAAAASVEAATGSRARAVNDLRAMLAELESKNWSGLAADVRASIEGLQLLR